MTLEDCPYCQGQPELYEGELHGLTVYQARCLCGLASPWLTTLDSFPWAWSVIRDALLPEGGIPIRDLTREHVRLERI